MKTDRAGWAGIVVVAVVADALGERTMSDLFRETSHHPVGRPILILTWATLTAHLFGLIPPSRDPIHLFFKATSEVSSFVRWTYLWKP